MFGKKNLTEKKKNFDSYACRNHDRGKECDIARLIKTYTNKCKVNSVKSHGFTSKIFISNLKFYRLIYFPVQS